MKRPNVASRRKFLADPALLAASPPAVLLALSEDRPMTGEGYVVESTN
jgi:hypothetical protein